MITVNLEVPVFFWRSEINYTQQRVYAVLSAFLSREELSSWHWSVFKPVDQKPVGVYVTVWNYPRGTNDHLQEIADRLALELRGLYRYLTIAVSVRKADWENQATRVEAKAQKDWR